jgi:hypothetical protein
LAGGEVMSDDIDCGPRKGFDQILHNDNDPFGRTIARDFLKRIFKIELFSNTKNKFATDLVDGNGIKIVEVETRGSECWAGNQFKHDPVNIPARKIKDLKSGEIHYASVSKDGKTIGLTLRETVYNAIQDRQIAVNENRLGPEGEKFLQISRDKWKFYDVKTGAVIPQTYTYNKR